MRDKDDNDDEPIPTHLLLAIVFTEDDDRTSLTNLAGGINTDDDNVRLERPNEASEQASFESSCARTRR